MPGVRIYHPTLRNCLYTVEHPRIYPVPFMCPTCKHAHDRKTYHLQVDGSGHVIVSETVLGRLREVGMAGFIDPQQVEKPPPINIGFGGMKAQPRIVRHYLDSNEN
jgi:hypothetical protein